MEDIRRRNQATIARAAELVNRGNMVSIFPSGSGGQALSGSSWKPGVGYLVSQISEPETRIVFAQIEGTKKSDIVAYMQPVVRKLWFRQRPINLRFSRPKRLIEIVGQLSDPKIIAKELERRYTAQMS